MVTFQPLPSTEVGAEGLVRALKPTPNSMGVTIGSGYQCSELLSGRRWASEFLINGCFGGLSTEGVVQW